MHFAVYCTDNENTFELRNKHRVEHREYLNTQLHRIFFSGPLLADDGILQIGSLFILSVDGRAEAQDFLNHEPYSNAGIFASVKIIRMRKGRFQPDNLCEEQEAPLRFNPFDGKAGSKSQ